MADELAGELVEDDELTAARGDGEGVVAELPVEFVGVQSGGVDEEAGAQQAAAGGQFMVGGAGDALHPAVEMQVDTAADGLGGVGEGGRPRADDALAGDVERAQGAGSEVRFAAAQLVGVDQAGLVVAVALGLGGERRQRVQLRPVPGDEQGADRFDGDTGLGRVGREPALSVAYEPGLQRTGHGVETGVQDRRVGLGGSVADVVGGVHEGRTQPAAGELAGDGRTDDSGADDDHVVEGVRQFAGGGDGHAPAVPAPLAAVGVRSSSAATSPRNRPRRSAACEALILGS